MFCEGVLSSFDGFAVEVQHTSLPHENTIPDRTDKSTLSDYNLDII